MIGIKSLRVGNILIYHSDYDDVGYNPNDEYYTVQPSDSMLKFEDKDYSPIPLTSKILEQCAFERIKGTSLFDYKDDTLEGYIDEADFTYTVGDQEVKIQYVHQLQNLFWCLCGEELQISL